MMSFFFGLVVGAALAYYFPTALMAFKDKIVGWFK